MGAVYGALSYLYWAYAVGAGYGDYWFYIYYDYLNYNDDGYHVSGPYFYEFGWGYFVYGEYVAYAWWWPLLDTSGPLTQMEQVSFTNTPQAQVLSSITGGLVTPPGCMEISLQSLDMDTTGMEITLGSGHTLANTMVDFSMMVPP